MKYQTTIKKEVKFSGIGLHTGKKVNLILKPLDADKGIIFIRDKVRINANLKNVSDSNFTISLGFKNIKVKTVEHLLAAVYGLEIDNLACEIDSEEVPLLDGSSFKFISLLKKAGIKKLNKERQEINLDKKISVYSKGRRIIATPCRGLKISYLVSYEHPLIQQQFREIKLSTESFIRDISRARTFGWLKQIKLQKKVGLIKGANLSNAVLFGKRKVMNKEGLRYKDEVVRHKILDLIGAIALLNKRINAHIIAVKSGHSLDIELIKKIGGYVC